MRSFIRAASICLVLATLVSADEPSPQRNSIELQSVEMSPLLAADDRRQELGIKGTWRGAAQQARATLDGEAIGTFNLTEGGFDHRLHVPPVEQTTQSQLIVETVDGELLAKVAVARQPIRQLTIYIVPHSHVDIGYTELQPAIEAKQVNNLLTALELIEQTKNNPPGEQYRWTVEAAWTIDNLLRDRPDKLAALQQAIQARQVELDGAFGNLLTALCRPEELLRSYAWGARYGKQYGVPVDAAMISDVPGYTWGTITALAEAGIKYFSIGPNLLDRIGTTLVEWEDRPFYWETADGKRKVLCWTSYKGYAWSIFIKQLNAEAITGYLAHLDRIKYDYDLALIRWSGHGDNAVPDAGLITSVRDWNARYEWPKLKITTVSEPFKLLEARYGARIPTVRGDWTPYWEDGAASSALETAMNRETAERLVTAETLWATLHPAGKFPASEFREAWRGAMLYSEHTWGAHCSVSEPENPLTVGQWNYKRGYALDADARSRSLLATALQSNGTPIANAVDVFNANSWKRTEVVRVAKELSAAGDQVHDDEGKIVPSQRLSTGELTFLATEVPAIASRRYTIAAGSATADNFSGGARVTENAIENETLKVVLDPFTGNVRQLASLTDDHNYVAKDSNGLNEYLYVEGAQFDSPQTAARSPKITVRENGPLVVSLVVDSAAPGCNHLTREVRLTASADFVELTDVVDKARATVVPGPSGGNPQDPNNGKEAVHFAFPFNVPDGEIRMDTSWACVQPEKDQIPGACKNWYTVQRWVDVSNAERGVTWAPVDAPLVQVGGVTANLIGSQTNPEVWQKKVRSSQSLFSWAMNNYWHTNYRAYQEGPTTFRYALRLHARYSTTEAQRFGIERSQPLIVAAAAERPSISAPRPVCDAEGVLVTAFKPADDGDGYVLRLFAGGGKDAQVRLAWEGTQPKAVYKSDSLESVGEKLGPEIDVPAWGIVTLRAK